MSEATKSKRVVLHVGLHKTATTAIQHFLAQNIQTLLKNGIRYVPLDTMRTDITPLFASLEQWRAKRLAQVIRGFNEQTIILSDENMIGSPRDPSSGLFYEFAEQRVKNFLDWNEDLNVSLVISIRNPATLLPSMYCEFLRHNDFIPFEKFIQPVFEAFPHFDFYKRFDWLHSLSDRISISVIPYEEEYGGGVPKVVGEILFQACGDRNLLSQSSFPTHRFRASFSQEEVRLASTIYEASDGSVARAFLSLLERQHKRFGSTRFSPISQNIRSKISASYEAILSKLCPHIQYNSDMGMKKLCVRAQITSK